MIDPIEYDDLAAEYALQQYKKDGSVRDLLVAFSSPFNETDQMFFDLFTILDIDLSVGKQLDVIGKIIGQRRLGLSDSEYRIRLKLRIAVNRSFGDPETAIALISALTGATRVQYIPQYPANATFFTNGTVAVPNLSDEVDSVTPLGVGSSVITSALGDTPFVFGGDDDGLGFNRVIGEVFLLDTNESLILDGEEFFVTTGEETDDEGGEMVGIFS
jgi:hypothetical protein